MFHFSRISIVVILVSILAAVIALYFIFINPLLVPDVPAVSSEGSEGLTITYPVPDKEDIEVATSFDAYIPPEQLVEPLEVPLPLNVVKQPYIDTFNGLVNKAVLIEEQLKKNIAPAMFAVQKEAGAGNFPKMFEHMLEAREQLTVLNTINTEFNAALLKYRIAYAVPDVSPAVRTSSEALDRSSVTLNAEVTQFSSLLAQSVDGSIPDQKLITDIEAANDRVANATAAFGKAMSEIAAAVKAPKTE